MLDFFLSYLLIYSYTVIFFVTYSSSFILPLPATAIIVASWAFATQWFLDINYVLITSFLWCLLGDLTGYFLAFYYGKKLLLKIWFAKIMNSSKYDIIEKYFISNSIKSIFLTRFILTWISQIINILAWITKIWHKKFLFYNLIWEIIHISSFVYIGYLLWYEWQNAVDYLEDILIAILVFVMLFVGFKLVVSYRKSV